LELSEEEALDLALNNNKWIVEIILENEYEESDYEETSHMTEISSISLGDLQVEELVIDNENKADNKNKEVKGDWILSIIQKGMIYKKSIFQLKSKYICEMMEGDLEIKDCEYDVGEVNLIIGKIFLSITKLENIGMSTLERSKFKLLHYNITTTILIFILCSVISGIPNLIIKFSQRLRLIYVMDQ